MTTVWRRTTSARFTPRETKDAKEKNITAPSHPQRSQPPSPPRDCRGLWPEATTTHPPHSLRKPPVPPETTQLGSRAECCRSAVSAGGLLPCAWFSPHTSPPGVWG